MPSRLALPCGRLTARSSEVELPASRSAGDALRSMRAGGEQAPSPSGWIWVWVDRFVGASPDQPCNWAVDV